MRLKIAACVVVVVGLCASLNIPAIADLPAKSLSGQAGIAINAPFVKKELSLDPFDSIWQRIPKVKIPLMPQTLFTPRGGGATKEIVAQILYTQNFLYLRLVWADATKTTAQEVHRTERFDDAVAVQFPLKVQNGYPSPFMGDPEHPVNIWQWKASWQESLDMTQAHPRTVRDDEPFANESTFRTGEAAGNLFSQPKRSSNVEHLIASGFGTLTTTKSQSVDGRGVWRDGRWHIVMRRAIVSRDNLVEVDLQNLPSIPIAFAVWDGAHLERDGMKSVSVWQDLVMERPIPWWVAWWKRLWRAKPAPLRDAPTMIAEGKRVFDRYGCATCHGASGRGGIRNPNAYPIEEIPSLVNVAKKFTMEELKEKIRQVALPARLDPHGQMPTHVMPNWGPVLNDDELEVLVAYLTSLLPQDEEIW